MVPASARAITASAPGNPSAVRRVPSTGSTATSTLGPVPFPIRSPLYSMGASSFSPSPITMRPSMSIVDRMVRIPSTAAWSTAVGSPRPCHRAAAMAAVSVTRTRSRPRLRSGTSVIAVHPNDDGVALSAAAAQRGSAHPAAAPP